MLLFTGTNAMAGAFFTDNGDGTVTDNRFELIWQQGYVEAPTWTDADSYCVNLKVNLPPNYNPWRLPDIKELAFLTDDTTHSPAIDTTYFPDTKSSFYWSSTPVVRRGPSARWGVNFSDGKVYGYDSADENLTDNKRYVRCVSEPSPQ